MAEDPNKVNAIVPYGYNFDLEAIRRALTRLVPKEETQRHGHPMFYKILEELAELHEAKNKQYATQDRPLGNFERGGRLMAKLFRPYIDTTLAACLAYMAKQIDGVYEMVGEGKTDTPDQLEDKLQDIAIYSILAMIIVRESETIYDIPTNPPDDIPF